MISQKKTGPQIDLWWQPLISLLVILPNGLLKLVQNSRTSQVPKLKQGRPAKITECPGDVLFFALIDEVRGLVDLPDLDVSQLSLFRSCSLLQSRFYCS